MSNKIVTIEVDPLLPAILIKRERTGWKQYDRFEDELKFRRAYEVIYTNCNQTGYDYWKTENGMSLELFYTPRHATE